MKIVITRSTYIRIKCGQDFLMRQPLLHIDLSSHFFPAGDENVTTNVSTTLLSHFPALHCGYRLQKYDNKVITYIRVGQTVFNVYLYYIPTGNYIRTYEMQLIIFCS